MGITIWLMAAANRKLIVDYGEDLYECFRGEKLLWLLRSLLVLLMKTPPSPNSYLATMLHHRTRLCHRHQSGAARDYKSDSVSGEGGRRRLFLGITPMVMPVPSRPTVMTRRRTRMRTSNPAFLLPANNNEDSDFQV